jgi:hypothetical protein
MRCTNWFRTELSDSAVSQSQRFAKVDTDIRTASGLTNRAVSDLAGDVITGDLGSIFWWVNECLANQTHGQADSNKFAIVNLLEDKDNVR